MKKITGVIIASSLIFCGSLLYSFNKIIDEIKFEQYVKKTIKQEAATFYLEKRLIYDDKESSKYWKDYNPDRRFNYEFFMAYHIALSRTDSIEDTHKKMKELFYTDEVCGKSCYEKVYNSDRVKNYISGIEELLRVIIVR